ncbi:MAG TPA: DNA polymerase III subunit delta [Isosphaeraceae bacterium]|jgi:DNA polymerase-3 subunit delta|nr:DNA polymerase III subunit delta [Isosphaeraceae bacterium]
MHAIDFLRQPVEGDVRPIYAVYGDEPYLRREALRTIARTALGAEADDLAVATFAGERATLADVLDELRMLPFLTRVRVVVVDDADPFVTAHRQELEEYAAKPAPTGVLVLSVKSWPSTTRLAKIVAKVGLAVECKSLSERELPEWLVDLSQVRFGTPMQEDAAELLVELIGPEVSLLVSEVEKLATYVGENGTIRRPDVSRMIGAGRIETIWKTLDAAASGQASEALHHLDRLLATGEAPVGLLAAMSYSLRKLYHVGQLRTRGHDVQTASREAGMPTYPAVIQNTLRQHKHLGPARVDALPELLLRADLDIKGFSTLSPGVILERLLIRLARPREEVEA